MIEVILMALGVPVMMIAAAVLVATVSACTPTIRVPSAGGTGTSTLTLKNTGRIFANNATGSDATADKGPWVNPSVNGAANLYEVKATVTAGTLSTGTTGSFLDLGAADRTWTVTRSGTGDSQATLTLDFRLKGTSTTLLTLTGITLEVSVP